MILQVDAATAAVAEIGKRLTLELADGHRVSARVVHVHVDVEGFCFMRVDMIGDEP